MEGICFGLLYCDSQQMRWMSAIHYYVTLRKMLSAITPQETWMKVHVQSGKVVQFLHFSGCSIHSANECSAIVDNFGSMVEIANQWEYLLFCGLFLSLPTIRFSLSGGRHASILCESRIIPKNGREVAGPSIFSKARGTQVPRMSSWWCLNLFCRCQRWVVWWLRSHLSSEGGRMLSAVGWSRTADLLKC